MLIDPVMNLPIEILLKIFNEVDLPTYCNVVRCAKWIYEELTVDKYAVKDVYQIGMYIVIKTTIGNKLHGPIEYYSRWEPTVDTNLQADTDLDWSVAMARVDSAIDRDYPVKTGNYIYGKKYGWFRHYNRSVITSEKLYENGIMTTKIIHNGNLSYNKLVYKNGYKYFYIDKFAVLRKSIDGSSVKYTTVDGTRIKYNMINDCITGIVERNGEFIDTSKITELELKIDNVIRIIHYKNGMYNGKYIQYRVNRYIQIVNYVDNKKHGECIICTPTLFEVLIYDNDILVKSTTTSAYVNNFESILQIRPINQQSATNRFYINYDYIRESISAGSLRRVKLVEGKYIYDKKYITEHLSELTTIGDNTKFVYRLEDNVITDRHKSTFVSGKWMTVYRKYYYRGRLMSETKYIGNTYTTFYYRFTGEIYRKEYYIDNCCQYRGNIIYINGFEPDTYKLVRDYYLINI